MSEMNPPAVRAANEILDPIQLEDFDININSPITLEQNGKDVQYIIKVAHSPKGDSQITSIRIELTREDDIFYVARCSFDASEYKQFQKSQKIRSSFANFIPDLNKIIDNVKVNRAAFVATFDGDILTFRQKLEFKSVDIFSLRFEKLDEEDPYVMQQAQFRYDFKRSNLRSTRQKLADLYEHVSEKNPQLLEQLRRGKDSFRRGK